MANLFPIEKVDGYLPIKEHGLIGDGATAAVVGRDGTIAWMCVPRFDSAPLFCSILDREEGGRFRLAPEGLRESAQRYREEDELEPGARMRLSRNEAGRRGP
jgi:GH15 family glucan-1,4-alpha-glucosidase